MTRSIVFRSNEDKIDVYINNKLSRQLTLEDFMNYCSINLSIVLYDFVSSIPMSEPCNSDGSIIVITSNESNSDRTITIKVGDKHHSETFRKVGVCVFHSDLIRYIYETLNNMKYDKIYEEYIMRGKIKKMNTEIAATIDTQYVEPIRVLNRLVNFASINVDIWESERFNVFGDYIHYNIAESTYTPTERKGVVDEAVKYKGVLKNKIYTLKRLSFINGASTNIICNDSSIYTLTKYAEEDLFKCMSKNCTNKYNANFLNTIIFIINTIDTIISTKTYDDNELYDYIKLRGYICRFIEYYGEIKSTNSKLISLINYIANFTVNTKKENIRDNIKNIERYIMILLFVETEKEKHSGIYTDTSNLLSEALRRLNFAKYLKEDA